MFPTLNRIDVCHKVPNQSEKVRGAMMWHRDDFGDRSLYLVIAITDIDDENGPIYSADNREKLGNFAKFSETINNSTSGERGKIEDQKFETYLKKNGMRNFKRKNWNRTLY